MLIDFSLMLFSSSAVVEFGLGTQLAEFEGLDFILGNSPYWIITLYYTTGTRVRTGVPSSAKFEGHVIGTSGFDYSTVFMAYSIQGVIWFDTAKVTHSSVSCISLGISIGLTLD